MTKLGDACGSIDIAGGENELEFRKRRTKLTKDLKEERFFSIVGTATYPDEDLGRRSSAQTVRTRCVHLAPL